MTLTNIYLIIGGVCLCGICLNFLKNSFLLADYKKYLKQFKSDKEIEDSCNNQLKSERLHIVDDLFEELTPNKLDVFCAKVKQDKPNNTLCDTIKSLYKEKRIESIKNKVKSIEVGFLYELNYTNDDNVKDLGSKIPEIVSYIDGIKGELNLNDELVYMDKLIRDYLKDDVKGALTIEELRELRSHVIWSIDSLKSILSSSTYEISTNYRKKLESIELDNYSILDYNERVVNRLYSLKNDKLLNKITDGISLLGFDVTHLDDNIFKVKSITGVGSFDDNFDFIVCLIRSDEISLSKKIVKLSKLKELEDLISKRDDISKDYKITLLTNIDFEKDAYEYIIDTHMFECLTLYRILSLKLVDDTMIDKKKNTLLGELYKQRKVVID